MQHSKGQRGPHLNPARAVPAWSAGLVLLLAGWWLPGCVFDTSGLSYSTSNNNNDEVCGNDLREGAEVCDGADLTGVTCVSQGFDSGTLACQSDCAGFDTSACEGTGPVCGDNLQQGTEVCDGPDLAGETCMSQGFEGGALTCLGNCTGFDTSQCTGPGPVCGDAQQEGAEVCDGADLAGETCVSQGFYAGTLGCLGNCTGFDTAGCTGTCGDDTVNGLEVCDGSDLASESCVSQGFYGGTLGCLGNCTGYDLAGCAGTCGDGAINGPEVCDGGDLASETCLSQGFYAGTLGCLGDCTGFDTAGCTGTCGDGAINGPEVCDGGDLAGETCLSQGFYTGTLGCLGTCAGYDLAGCSGVCGDGVVNGPEECDGADLGGSSCATLGCQSGTLVCNPNCTFNPTGCYANHDEDGDTVDDNCDNCPTYPNLAQPDADGDGVGDACEAPWAPSLLSQITDFRSFLTDTAVWTTYGGTWTSSPDEYTGTAIGTGGNAVHPTVLPNVDYSVEATFHMGVTSTPGNAWTAVLFAWSITAGSSLYAYECAYDRSSDVISIWRISGGGSFGSLASTTVSTTVTSGQWHRLRAFRDGDTVRCLYDDETGASDGVQVSGSLVWNDMSGQTGLRVFDESTTFTSFVIYQ